ncbi:MAG: Lipid A deacylase PagL precursor [Syntrophus sp. PtaB.Bin001]|nr:MAG: Lipid A deacylase PagL precursor [Syntrophus sp. PtaB.Bin001]
MALRKKCRTIRCGLFPLCYFVCIFILPSLFATAGELSTSASDKTPPVTEIALNLNDSTIWDSGVGEGFRAGTQNLGVNAGIAYGVTILGSEERHHLALLSVSYGRIIGGVKGTDSWFRGNWELRGEIFGGGQFNSESSWLVGFTPHVRYHFATGSPWVPYVDLGVGATLTGIREPDLGGSFQFNLQGSVGVNYFFKDGLAINLEGRYIHLSSAGIFEPNNGVNSTGIFFGVSKFF